MDDPEAASPVVGRLEAAGFATAGDLARNDPRVVSLVGQPVRGLPEWIDHAWVASAGGGRPHLRRGVEALSIPGADIEIDIDMENAIDGTAYLWGALVHDEYHGAPFAGATGFAVAAQVFVQFWDWLHARLVAADERGQTVVIYCWHQDAEAGALKAGPRRPQTCSAGPTHPGRSPSCWPVISSSICSRSSGTSSSMARAMGSKVVAPKAGFAWRYHSPSGQDSMAWHLSAVSDPEPSVRRANQERLLAYNEDDVRATATIRAWMRGLDPPALP